MVSFDIVADSIARINNAQMAKHLVTKLKFAKKNICFDESIMFIGIY